MDKLFLLTLQLRHFAQTSVSCEPGQANSCDTGLPHVGATSANVQNILQVVFGIIGAVAVIFMVLSGLRFITAQGDPQGVARARQSIIYAALGLAVAISAEAIVTFVLGRL